MKKTLKQKVKDYEQTLSHWLKETKRFKIKWLTAESQLLDNKELVKKFFRISVGIIISSVTLDILSMIILYRDIYAK